MLGPILRALSVPAANVAKLPDDRLGMELQPHIHDVSTMSAHIPTADVSLQRGERPCNSRAHNRDELAPPHRFPRAETGSAPLV